MEWIQTFSVISAILTGFLFAIIRFFEPYLIFIIKKEISEWFGILLEEQSDDNDSLSAILIQSLNVELVNVILKAVAYDEDKYMVDRNGRQTRTPYQRQQYESVDHIPKDMYKSAATYNLKGLKIQDAYEVAKDQNNRKASMRDE